MSDGCGRLALCAYEEDSPRPGGRYRRAGRVAVYLPGGRRNRLADHDRYHALQGLAAVSRGAIIMQGITCRAMKRCALRRQSPDCLSC